MLPLPYCQLDKRCWTTRIATSDLSLPTNSAPPSSLAQSWQYWRWSCWAHYSPNRLRCSAAPLWNLFTKSNDPIQSNPIPRILSSQTPMWLNVTQRDSKFKGETTSLHPVFSDKHLHPRLHCIEGSSPAMALALRLWTWEIRKWVSQTLQIMLQLYKHLSPSVNISISFSRSQHVTACSNGASELCTLSTEFLSGELGRSLELTASVNRTKRVAPMAWHSGTAGTSIQLSKISILVKFCYHLHIYIYIYIWWPPPVPTLSVPLPVFTFFLPILGVYIV